MLNYLDDDQLCCCVFLRLMKRHTTYRFVRVNVEYTTTSYGNARPTDVCPHVIANLLSLDKSREYINK